MRHHAKNKKKDGQVKNMLGILLFLFYIALGIFTGYLLFEEQRPLTKIWLGSVFGMVMFIWSNIPFSFFMGFTRESHIAGLALTLLTVAAIFFFKKRFDKKHPQHNLEAEADKAPDAESADSIEEAKGAKKFFKKLGGKLSFFTTDEWVMLIFIAIFMIFPALTLPSHTLQEIEGSYWTGQCTYGDMNMHLGFITSIANQGMFPPEYNILPGEPLNYPFLCDTVSSSLYIFGTSLRLSYMIPMFFAFALVFFGFWNLGSAILKNTSKTAVAFTLFFLNGGFGTIYFLDHVTKEDKTNFTRIFTEFYQTPTNLVNSGKNYTNIRWTNTLVDMMLPQRATLFGWVLLFAALWLLYNAVFEKKGVKYFLVSGIVAGLLPMVHTHSYFATGLIAICWIIYSCVRDRMGKKIIPCWLSFGIPALALSLPQIFKWTFSAVGESFLRKSFDWCNETDNPIWFWVKNIGLVLLLLPPAFINADKKKKAVYTGAMLIFLLAEFFVFQPNDYDNNKLFLVWYIFTAIIVADFMVDCYKKLKGVKGRVLIAVLVMAVCTNAAVLTCIREVKSGQYKSKEDHYAYQLYSADMVKATEWINENTEPDAMFLCHNQHNNAVASLTGRNIFVGSGTFLYFHGTNYQERESMLPKLFNNEEAFEDARLEYGIDYVFISSYEKGNYSLGVINHLDDCYEVVYKGGEVTIYDVR